VPAARVRPSVLPPNSKTIALGPNP
jgi:hypothetical protein